MMAGSLQAHEQSGLKKRRFWTPEEDQKLLSYMEGRDHKSVRWTDVPNAAGLNRCRKSCWLRWTKYLSPDIKRGNFSEDEVNVIINLHSLHGNSWASMARVLRPRTDNEIKNYYNTRLKKKDIPSLSPDIKRGNFSEDEVNGIMNLDSLIGNSWASMARVLCPRTDNEIKNYYNTHLKKKLSKKDIPSSSQSPLHEIGLISTDPAEDLPSQTRGFNSAMENPTVYNNYAADPGLDSLYGNATNEGSTPALMVSLEDVRTPPPEVSVSNDAWIYECYPEDQTVYNNYAADPGLVCLYGNATNEGSTPEPMVSVENWPSPLWGPWPEEFLSEDQTGETSDSFGGDTALVQHTPFI